LSIIFTPVLFYDDFSIDFRVFTYEQFWKDLSTFSQAWDKVLLPNSFTYNPGSSHRVVEQVRINFYKTKKTNIYFWQIPKESRLLQPSPIMMLKAVKNSVEIEGMRRAHIRDAAAICEFMAYFEEKVCRHQLDLTFALIFLFRDLKVKSGMSF